MSDLTGLRQPLAFASNIGLRLQPPVSRWILRGGPEVASAAAAAFGIELPAKACRAAHAQDRAALWLGPDEHLLLAPLAMAAAIEQALEQALVTVPHSLVDVSHRQVALEMRGARARTMLSAGCPLNLAEDDFPLGACTRTMLGKADIVLWRNDPETFHLEVWRSFARYVWDFLAEAALDVDPQLESPS